MIALLNTWEIAQEMVANKISLKLAKTKGWFPAASAPTGTGPTMTSTSETQTKLPQEALTTQFASLRPDAKGCGQRKHRLKLLRSRKRTLGRISLWSPKTVGDCSVTTGEVLRTERKKLRTEKRGAVPPTVTEPSHPLWREVNE
eukprot:g16071.t1